MNHLVRSVVNSWKMDNLMRSDATAECTNRNVYIDNYASEYTD